MTRIYTLKRRAEKQAETRHRIAEAALDLHSTLGPALTTISMVAERAGVQRHTLYAHFPDERSLFLACSGLHIERNPLPDSAPWREITELEPRLRAGLSAIYDWYARNASIAACILRDAEFHALTRETVELRMGPTVAAWHEVLGQGLDERKRAMMTLALSFHTWRTLTQQAGLAPEAAVETMVRAVVAA